MTELKPCKFGRLPIGAKLSFSRLGFPRYVKRSSRTVEMITRYNGESSVPNLWFYAKQAEPCYMEVENATQGNDRDPVHE